MTPCDVKADQRAAEGLRHIAALEESRLELSQRGELREAAIEIEAGRAVPLVQRLKVLAALWRFAFR